MILSIVVGTATLFMESILLIIRMDKMDQKPVDPQDNVLQKIEAYSKAKKKAE